MGLLEALLLDPYPFEIWVAKRTDVIGGAGSGTLNDPYNASDAASFDAIMNTISGMAATKVGVVHLGPDTFDTNGFNARTGAGWQPKAGTRITGSGIDATTLRLVGASEAVTATHYYIVGHTIADADPPKDMFEISHLTLDCNLAAAGSKAACGGIRLMGHHVKVHRIKVINWGTRTSLMPCRAISVLSGLARTSPTADDDLKKTGIENCIVVNPALALSSGGTLTALHIGSKLMTELGSETGTDNERFGKGPYIRNCFVDLGSGTALWT